MVCQLHHILPEDVLAYSHALNTRLLVAPEVEGEQVSFGKVEVVKVIRDLPIANLAVTLAALDLELYNIAFSVPVNHYVHASLVACSLLNAVGPRAVDDYRRRPTARRSAPRAQRS